MASHFHQESGNHRVLMFFFRPSEFVTVDGRNPTPVGRWLIPLFLGFNHPRWCRISSIHRMSTPMADAKAEVSRCASPWATVPRRSFAPRPATPAARYGTSVLAQYQLCVVWKKPGNVTIGIPLWVEKVQETNGIYGIQAPFFPEHIICRFFFNPQIRKGQLILFRSHPTLGRKVERQRVNSSFSWKVEDSYTI